MINNNRLFYNSLSCLAWVIVAFLIIPKNVYADNPDNPAVWANTCTSNGGKILSLAIQFDHQKVSGLTRDFCEFNSNTIVGLEVLSKSTPTLAATFVQELYISPIKPIPAPSGNPAYDVCLELSGTMSINNDATSGYYVPGGQMSMCVFGDGSMLDAQSLLYLASGSEPDAKALITSTPLPIVIPDIYAKRPAIE